MVTSAVLCASVSYHVFEHSGSYITPLSSGSPVSTRGSIVFHCLPYVLNVFPYVFHPLPSSSPVVRRTGLPRQIFTFARDTFAWSPPPARHWIEDDGAAAGGAGAGAGGGGGGEGEAAAVIVDEKDSAKARPGQNAFTPKFDWRDAFALSALAGGGTANEKWPAVAPTEVCMKSKCRSTGVVLPRAVSAVADDDPDAFAAGLASASAAASASAPAVGSKRGRSRSYEESSGSGSDGDDDDDDDDDDSDQEEDEEDEEDAKAKAKAKAEKKKKKKEKKKAKKKERKAARRGRRGGGGGGGGD